MILVVDVGNTNITYGVFKGDKMVSSFRMTTGTTRTSDEYGLELLGVEFYSNVITCVLLHFTE